MNLFIPFLMLIMPGVIAVSRHNGQLIHITRENWQPVLWMYMLYSFAIVFAVNAVMFISYPQRQVSYSALVTENVTSSTLAVGFIVKYSLTAAIAALVLPNIWRKGRNIKEFKPMRISKDE